jgi:hypothetical protein
MRVKKGTQTLCGRGIGTGGGNWMLYWHDTKGYVEVPAVYASLWRPMEPVLM